MADKTYTLEIIAKGLKEVTRGLKQLSKEGAKVEKTQGKSTKGTRDATNANKAYSKEAKGTAQLTSNQTKAFSKMSNQMQGSLVGAYATVAANVFALTAAFGALERAADFQILIDSAEILAEQTGRSLKGLAKDMKAITGEAISMKEALTNASIAASAGFDNSTIKELTQVARNASVALGREMTDSLNRVFKGAIKAEPELLDELGIILRLETATRKYSAALGKSAKDLTTFEKQQAVVNEVLEQGQKKFDRLSEVDPNPYTKLSAAFYDVSTSMINIVATPITGVLNFLTENTLALTAALIFFSTTILKRAFPALKEFSQHIDTHVNASIKKMETNISRIGTFFGNLIPDAAKKSLEKSGKTISAITAETKAGFATMGKDAGPGFKKLDSMLDGTIGKTKQFKAVYGAGLNLLKKGMPALGMEATEENIQRVTAALEMARGTIATVGTAAQTAQVRTVSWLSSVVTYANAAAAGVTKLGYTIYTSFLTGISTVNSATNGFVGFYTAVRTAGASVSGFSKIFAVASGTIGAGFAGILKMVPWITGLTVAFQILKSVVMFVWNLFADVPEIDLSKTLEGTRSTLEELDKATKNYEKNLAHTTNTLDNIIDRLTLYTNSMGELSNIIKTINSDIKESGGFDWLDVVWDRLGGGGVIEETAEQIELMANRLRELGQEDEVNALLGDITDIASESAGTITRLGIAFEEMTSKLQKAAAETKEVYDRINTEITKLDESLSKLSQSYGSLSDAQQGYLNVSSIVDTFKAINGEAVLVGSTLEKLTSSNIAILNLGSELADLRRYNVEIDELGKKRDKLVEEQKKAKGNWGSEWMDAGIAIDMVDQKVKELEGTINSTIGKALIDKLNTARNEFKSLVYAAEDFNAEMLDIKIDDLVSVDNVNNSIDNINRIFNANEKLAKEENRVRDAQLARARESKDAIIEEKDALKKALKESTDTKGSPERQELVNSLAQQVALLGTAEAEVIRLSESANKSSQDRINLIAKDISKLQGMFSKAAEKGIYGSQVAAEDKKRILDAAKEKLKALTLEVDADVGEKEAESKLRKWIDRIEESDALNIRFKLAGIDNVDDILRDVNTLIADTLATSAKNELARGTTVEQDMSVTADSDALLRQLDTQILIAEKEAQSIQNTTLLAEEKKRINLLEEKRVELAENIEVKANAAAIAEKKASKLKIDALKSELKYGTAITTAIRHQIALKALEAKYANASDKDRKAAIDSQKELNKQQNKSDYLDNLKSGAESMNEFAEAMNNFADSMSTAANGTQEAVAGLTLMQEIASTMDGPLGKISQGLASISLATIQYNEQMKIANAEGNESNKVEMQRKAAMDLTLNSLGALAGSFEEGSKAAKVFTAAQKLVAIANAAAAVTAAGTTDPYTAPARVAAMLSLMAAVLSTFGVGGGGGSGAGSSGPTAEEKYKESIGSQGLVGRELKNNSMVESLDALVDIDTQLYSATRDLQITMDKLAGEFSRLAASIFDVYADTSGVGGMFDSGSITSDATSGMDKITSTALSGIGAMAAAAGGYLASFGLFSLGGAFALGGAALNWVGGLFSNTTTLTEKIIDSGLDFTAALSTAGGEIIGTLDTQAFAYKEFQKRTTHTFHSDSVTTWYDTEFKELDASIQKAFTDTFDNVLSGITGLVSEFSSNAGNINLDTLFSGLSSLDLSQPLSLEGLDEDETAEAIGAYFSAISEDIVEATLPFLTKYREAGDSLTDTLIRLTTESMQVNNALATVGKSMSDFTTVDIGGGTGQAAEAFKVEVVAAWNTALLDGFKDVGEFEKAFEIFAEQIFDPAELAGYSIDNATANISNGFDQLITMANKMGRTDLVKILEEGGFNPETIKDFYTTADTTGAFDAAVSADGTIDTIGADLLNLLTNMGPSLAALEEAEKVQDDLDKAVNDLNESYRRQIALFGLVGKEAELLELSFNFEDALKEAEETGSNLALVEEYYGLERLAIVKKYQDAINDLNASYEKQITLFGLVGKEAELFELSFDFEDALKEAEETGSNLALVEEYYGLERLAIVEKYQDAINDLNASYEKQITLFGLVGKEAELFELSFNFEDALKEAEETGADLALVEEYYGLERLAIVKKYQDAIVDLDNSYKRKIDLFGVSGKDAELMQLDFNFEDALKEAEETGSDLALVEEYYGLERLSIVEKYLKAIDDLNASYTRKIDLFGVSGKDADLLKLSFKFEDALKEAEETGSDLALVEEYYGLERLAIVEKYQDAISDLNASYEEQITLFGLVGKEADLLKQSFKFEDAIEKAEKTGSDLALVEEHYGLERLAIVKKYYEETAEIIASAMDSMFTSITDISRNFDNWDEVLFTSIKLDKTATKLSNSLGNVDLSIFELDSNMSGLDEFSTSFSEIIDGLISAEAVSSLDEQVDLVNELRELTLSNYEEELSRLTEINTAAKEFSTSVREYLDDLTVSEESPLTNFERLTEAQAQFNADQADLQSSDPETVQRAQDNLLDSASTLLDQAGLFYSIGDEYNRIFDSVTAALEPLSILPNEDPVQVAIDNLTNQTLEKLNVLDGVLEQLQIANELTLTSDIMALGDVLLPSIDAISDKLQSLNDSTWAPILNVLSGLNSYAVGTPNVEYDQLAMIHKGEAILPADQADALRAGGMVQSASRDNSDVVAAINILTQVLAESQEDIANMTAKNVEISRDIANTVSSTTRVNTKGVA